MQKVEWAVLPLGSNRAAIPLEATLTTVFPCSLRAAEIIYIYIYIYI
jgi:hypothetical protein